MLCQTKTASVIMTRRDGSIRAYRPPRNIFFTTQDDFEFYFFPTRARGPGGLGQGPGTRARAQGPGPGTRARARDPGPRPGPGTRDQGPDPGPGPRARDQGTGPGHGQVRRSPERQQFSKSSPPRSILRRGRNTSFREIPHLDIVLLKCI